MSRISKKPIPIPSGVEVTVKDGEIVVKGKGGTLTRTLHPAVAVSVSGQEVQVSPAGSSRLSRALPGTFAAHIKNMLAGVREPFSKKLQVEGIGFRAEVSGTQLKLMLGLSHPVLIQVPAGITAQVDKNVITISGIDKEKVGQFAASVRALKKPEPYKGKGIRYEGEVVRRKQGKKAVTAAAA